MFGEETGGGEACPSAGTRCRREEWGRTSLQELRLVVGCSARARGEEVCRRLAKGAQGDSGQKERRPASREITFNMGRRVSRKGGTPAGS